MKKYIEPVNLPQEDLDKLSYSDLYAIFSMSEMISKDKYHPDYITYYKSLYEAMRMELDKRIQEMRLRLPPSEYYPSSSKGIKK